MKVNERIKREDQIHTQDYISQCVVFTLLISIGPKKQDITEIKARLSSAKSKSKHSEMIERMNLAYSRIMIVDSRSVGIDVEEEKQIDSQFQLMMKIERDIESNTHGTIIEDNMSEGTYTSPHKKRDAFDLLLFAARRIFMRRRGLYSVNDQFQDPYLALFTVNPKGGKKNMLIQLEFLNTLLMVSRDEKEKQVNGDGSVHSNTDQRALQIGKELVSQMITEMNRISSKRTGRSDESTLFSTINGVPASDIGRLVNDSKEHFTRAISLYYSSENDYDKAVEWCNLLIEIMKTSQQCSCLYKNGNDVDTERDRSDRVISGIMSTKALSLSMTNSHGAALKTAREAWEKYGLEVGNLVTLFHCSVHYEAFSDSEECKGTFDNSFLELDNAISNFFSLSKITKTNESSQEKLLQSFPVMCNTALQIEKSKTGPLLLGIQRRYIDLFVTFVHEKISTSSSSIAWNEKQGLVIPGENNLFSILCSYLGNIDSILTSSGLLFRQEWYLTQLKSLQSTIDNVLRLLIALRDQQDKESSNGQDSLLKFAESFKEDQSPSLDNEPVLLFERNLASQLIGSSASCLWTGKLFMVHHHLNNSSFSNKFSHYKQKSIR